MTGSSPFLTAAPRRSRPRGRPLKVSFRRPYLPQDVKRRPAAEAIWHYCASLGVGRCGGCVGFERNPVMKWPLRADRGWCLSGRRVLLFLCWCGLRGRRFCLGCREKDLERRDKIPLKTITRTIVRLVGEVKHNYMVSGIRKVLFDRKKKKHTYI